MEFQVKLEYTKDFYIKMKNSSVLYHYKIKNPIFSEKNIFFRKLLGADLY